MYTPLLVAVLSLTGVILASNIAEKLDEYRIEVDIGHQQNRQELKKVMEPISINFIERLDVVVWGVTKLRSEIHVLCHKTLFSTNLEIDGPHSDPPVIRVFEDRSPFHQQRDIEIKPIASPSDIVSSEKENCLYVSDYKEKCVWKITRETDDQYNIIKWLDTDYNPRTLSVSNDGQLLVVSHDSSILRIYGPDAKLLSIQLPSDIEAPWHAVETSIGNFIILHKLKAEEDEKGSVSRWIDKRKWVVSELSRDGHMVIHRFIPSNEEQKLNNPSYLSLDSYDRVIVAVWGENRVILLNSDLTWNRILCPTKEDTAETMLSGPHKLYYDKEKKQLIVGGSGVNIYTMN